MPVLPPTAMTRRYRALGGNPTRFDMTRPNRVVGYVHPAVDGGHDGGQRTEQGAEQGSARD